MHADAEGPEPFPDLDARGALRAAFRREPVSGESAQGTAAYVAARVARRGYDLQGEIARGGMGIIVKALDRGLERGVALKVLRPDLAREPRVVRRFLEEAQVTGQLEHPGIVPVHELGLDGEGRVFIAMKLVTGRDLRAVFELVFADQEGWNETRALTVLLRVCEAVAYAHQRGVIHRDLKPANVMVGDFGEVYVMDWGLARVLGRQDKHDIRLQDTAAQSPRRGETAAETPLDSPLLTMDGDIVGTPAYMPPEQARGEIERLGPHSDVYAIGAMLYHLLSRRMPYVESARPSDGRSVLARVRDGPPEPLAELRRDIPAELIAIAERAMERQGERRYRDMLSLAEDLRAYLEHRVVQAHRTGALAELRKWVERNKGFAAASAAAVLALAAGLVASLVLRSRALASEQLATERADDVLRLSALQDLDDLEAEAARLWPAEPGMIPRYEAWVGRAQILMDQLPGHEKKLAELVARTSADPDRADQRERWWVNQLGRLVERSRAFAAPETGLFSSGISPEHGWGVEKRLEFARSLRDGFAGGEYAAAWSQARPGIEQVYPGLELAPQVGLLPIGQDPDSWLWEFAHLATGAPPVRAPNGTLVLKEGTGLVFVLLPGGEFLMGAQATDPAGANYDPGADHDEGPVHAVTLSPFFLSKYEMTQAQWLHFAGHNPSNYQPAGQLAESLLNPAEQFSWDTCRQLCDRMGLTLPTEAQWEYAARGGTTTVFWTGDERDSLRGAANLADQSAKRANAPWDNIDDWPELDDGFPMHAPVDRLQPNPFGLHHMLGNVWEWCQDLFEADSYAQPVTLDPLFEDPAAYGRVIRGGGFHDAAAQLRSAGRFLASSDQLSNDIGFRPALRVAP